MGKTRVRKIFQRQRQDDENKRKESTYVVSTYVRVLIPLAIVAALVSLLAHYKIIFTPPTSLYDASALGSYLMLNVVFPSTLLFGITVWMSWKILSQRDAAYLRWLLQESWMMLAVNFLIFITSIMLFLAVFLSYVPENYFTTVGSSGMNRAQVLLWNFTVMAMCVPMWFGYREGWRSYKQIGATTQQQEYEEYLQKLEIRNSGQVWDRRVMSTYNMLTGADGHKPRGGLLWLGFIGLFGTTFLWTVSTLMGFPYLIGLSVFFIMPMVLGVFMSVAKWRDMRSVKKPPVLTPVRGKDYGDTYNPSSVGVRVFDRR